MRVLVTGGTGLVGAGVVGDLLGHGHEVLALARSQRSELSLTMMGADVVRGSLETPAVLCRAASGCDAVIHTAFDNASLWRFPLSARTERAALQAMADGLGAGRPLVAAGGFAPVQPSGPVLLETDPASARVGPMGRNVERTVMRLAVQGTNASVVRMACVHGDGDRFTLRRLIDLARRTGRSAFVGDGRNLVPAVFHRDAAGVFRLAVERAAPASRYHAVGEEGVAFGDIAAVIGRRLDVPVVSLDGWAARRHFGALHGYASGNRPASSALTAQLLHWTPSGPPLLGDLDRAGYFAASPHQPGPGAHRGGAGFSTGSAGEP